MHVVSFIKIGGEGAEPPAIGVGPASPGYCSYVVLKWERLISVVSIGQGLVDIVVSPCHNINIWE